MNGILDNPMIRDILTRLGFKNTNGVWLLEDEDTTYIAVASDITRDGRAEVLVGTGRTEAEVEWRGMVPPFHIHCRARRRGAIKRT